jgi:hypothetical protein
MGIGLSPHLPPWLLPSDESDRLSCGRSRRTAEEPVTVRRPGSKGNGLTSVARIRHCGTTTHPTCLVPRRHRVEIRRITTTRCVSLVKSICWLCRRSSSTGAGGAEAKRLGLQAWDLDKPHSSGLRRRRSKCLSRAKGARRNETSFIVKDG